MELKASDIQKQRIKEIETKCRTVKYKQGLFSHLLMKAFPYNKVERTDGCEKWKNSDCRYCRRAGIEYCHRIECHSWENKENGLQKKKLEQ